ncbi:type VI secretion system contractile sheath small subunit [Reinekea sp. G2M2-21]|jgi:type VI secretion system protein ImpB|uniref:type VI secretion system contractile sheath small subunit n=1 Tax=Reinekea sp. G2M2-21 TaxID=2788942 RepID=UPI0018AAFB4E|nr:type VI secretion system contractile sheath small subunit [Reinekea sp. G2M2-21]MDX1341837.1 type VI secretion system contractile sheath small subunit [Reinekea sp.]
MGDSFQNEIPRARVNIALDLETGGATVKKELPLKLLVMGDFSNGKGEGDLAERQRVNITGNNLEQVMEDMAPSTQFTVPNQITKDPDSEIKVDLTFKSFKDFHPEQVAAQIPEVSSMLAMRNLLKDLKSNLLDNSALRKEVERIMNSEADLNTLKDELSKHISVAQSSTEADAE